LPIGQIDDAEKELLAAAVKELGPSIEKVRSLLTNGEESVADLIGCFFPACSP
jgi:hypothetical protein